MRLKLAKAAARDPESKVVLRDSTVSLSAQRSGLLLLVE